MASFTATRSRLKPHEVLYILANNKKGGCFVRSVLCGLLPYFLFAGESNVESFRAVGDLLVEIDFDAFESIIISLRVIFYFE